MPCCMRLTSTTISMVSAIRERINAARIRTRYGVGPLSMIDRIANPAMRAVTIGVNKYFSLNCPRYVAISRTAKTSVRAISSGAVYGAVRNSTALLVLLLVFPFFEKFRQFIELFGLERGIHGRYILLPDLFINFLPVHGDPLGRPYAQLDLVALDVDDADFDIVPDHYAFIESSRQYQHVLSPRRPFSSHRVLCAARCTCRSGKLPAAR